MPKRFLVAWTCFALLFSIQITSCSLIGYGVGSAIDATRKPKLIPGTAAQVIKLAPGARLSIRMEDGSTIVGTYRGLDTQPNLGYVDRYQAWRDTAQGLPFRPPPIGESIRIVGGNEHSITGSKSQGLFLGFGPQRVHYRVGRQGSAYTPFMGNRRMMDRSGEVVSARDLEGLWGRLPVQTIALLKDGQAEHGVDLQDPRIEAIRFALPHHGFRNAGLVVGIFTDATLVVAAVALSESSSSGSCEPSYDAGYYYSLAVPVPAGTAADSVYVMPRAREWLALAR